MLYHQKFRFNNNVNSKNCSNNRHNLTVYLLTLTKIPVCDKINQLMTGYIAHYIRRNSMKGRFSKIAILAIMLSIMMVLGACSNQDNDDVKADSSAADLSVVDEIDVDEIVVDEIVVDEIVVEDDKSEKNVVDETDSVVVEETIPIQDVPLIEGGIKGVYEENGLKAGTCINGFVIKSLSDNITENYNSITLENDMKPEAILSQSKSKEAGDLVVEFNANTIEQLDWAKNNNMKARGHVLVWHSQTPQWIFYEDFDTKNTLVDRDTMLARMDSYIKQTFELLEELGYTDMFYAYDVVNEAIEDDGSLRESLWKKIIGDDYIWHSFYYADKYAPEHIKLYYNDYNEQFKTEAIVELAESLVDENGRSLIDGIGCQAHLYTQDSIFKYMKTLEAFSATGLDVQITEIDVSLGTWQNILEPTEENLLAQGQYYYELVNSIIEGNKAGTTNVSGITFWGVSDMASWRRDRSPLLFDNDLKPKYAYFGAVQDKNHAGY